jgi:hypothetical protein
MEELIISFSSTNYAMQTEAVLKREQITMQIMPTPREITLSCGLSIKTSMENLDRIKQLAKEEKIQVKELYKLSLEEQRRQLEKL